MTSKLLVEYVKYLFLKRGGFITRSWNSIYVIHTFKHYLLNYKFFIPSFIINEECTKYEIKTS